MPTPADCPPLEVIVPHGRDDFADYRGGVPAPAAGAHAPVNFHALAAASGACFHRTTATVPRSSRHVLVLVPRRAGRALRALRALRRRGHAVLVGWKECGAHQIAAQMERWFAVARWRALLAECDAALAASPAAEAFFDARDDARGKLVVLPTPYPLELGAWDFSQPLEARAGIFVGTREPGVPSRRHAGAVALALRAARAAGTHVTVLQAGPEVVRAGGDAGSGAADGQPDLRVVAGPLPYADYLRLMSRHRVVVQRDASAVPGQVAGDALLCRMPCLGGNGMVDRIAFPFLPAADDGDDDALAATVALLRDPDAWRAAVARSQRLAAERLSFAAFARHWRGIASRMAAG